MTSDAFIDRVVDHCRVLGLPERGMAYVREVALSGPSRSVQSRRGNVTVRFASRKMGQTISAESHSVELTFIWLQEWRNETRWYFDQPVQIPLRYNRPDGKVVSILYTPDFLTIEADRVRLTECKPRDALVELAAKHPGRYVLDAAGNLGSPCAEAAAAELGIGFRVWSPSQSDQVFARNARFLTDFLRDDLPPVPNQIGGQVRDVVRQCPGVTIGELRRQLAVVNPDAVHTLIARGDLFVHLHRDPVAEPDGCPLFLDESTALAHAALLDSIRPVDRTGSRFRWRSGLRWSGRTGGIKSPGSTRIR